MESQELENYFINLLHQKNEFSFEDICNNLENIYELSIRYWHTYKVMSTDLKKEISVYLINNSNYESYTIMDIVTAIIPLLGLQEVWNRILSDKPQIQNKCVISLINDAIDDYGLNIEDPYSSMKK